LLCFSQLFAALAVWSEKYGDPNSDECFCG